MGTIITLFERNGVGHFEKNGQRIPISRLFELTSVDLNRSRADDDATLGFFRDSNTNSYIASIGQGLYRGGRLEGVINRWDQATRTLRDIDNNILLAIPNNYNSVADLPSGYSISVLSIADQAMYDSRRSEIQDERYLRRMRSDGMSEDEIHLTLLYNWVARHGAIEVIEVNYNDKKLQLENLIKLDLRNKGINNIQLLSNMNRNMPNVKGLDLGYNKIIDLLPLKDSMPKAERLYLNNNIIVDLSPLKDLIPNVIYLALRVSMPNARC